jgi:hypothetical protein
MNNSSGSTEYKSKIIKTSLFLVFLTLLAFQNNKTPSKKSNIECLYDYGIIATEKISAAFLHYRPIRDGFIIVSSLYIDAILISIMIYWSLYGKSWRLIMTVFKFYSFRAFLQVKLALII